MTTCAKLSVLFSLVAALVVALPASTVLAEPFVYVTMKARVLNGTIGDPEAANNTRPFTAGYLGVTGGQTVQYQLFVEMATPVKTNSTPGGVPTLSSTVFLVDGIAGGKFHLWEDPAAPIQVNYQLYKSTGTTQPFKWDDQMTTPVQEASKYLLWSTGTGAWGGTRVVRSGTNNDLRNFRFIVPAGTPFFAGIAGVYSYSYEAEDPETGEIIIVHVDVPVPQQALLGYGRLRVATTIGSGDSELQMGYKSPPAPWWPGSEAAPYVGSQTETVLGAKVNGGAGSLLSSANDADPYIGFNTLTLYAWAAPAANIGTQTVPDTEHPYTVMGLSFGGTHASGGVAWDLDGDGLNDDLQTANFTLPASALALIGPGLHTIGVQINTTEGDSASGSGSLNIIPEPATLALLGLGLASIIRRRRHG